MITSDGLIYIYRVLSGNLSHDKLQVGLYDANGIECTFSGYARHTLDNKLWFVGEDGIMSYDKERFTLLTREITFIGGSRVYGVDGTVISDMKYDSPYTLQYSGEYIDISIKLDIIRV